MRCVGDFFTVAGAWVGMTRGVGNARCHICSFACLLLFVHVVEGRVGDSFTIAGAQLGMTGTAGRVDDCPADLSAIRIACCSAKARAYDSRSRRFLLLRCAQVGMTGTVGEVLSPCQLFLIRAACCSAKGRCRNPITEDSFTVAALRWE